MDAIECYQPFWEWELCPKNLKGLVGWGNNMIAIKLLDWMVGAGMFTFPQGDRKFKTRRSLVWTFSRRVIGSQSSKGSLSSLIEKKNHSKKKKN